MRPFFVYILRCGDGSFYVGHTDDLERRISQHKTGALPCSTLKKLPVGLVFVHEVATRIEALELERQIKGWTRRKKIALTRGDIQALEALARGKNASDRTPLHAGPSTPPAAKRRATLRANG